MDKSMTDVFYEKIDGALQSGAAYADIYVQSSSGHSLHYEDCHLEEVSSSIADGCGARLVIGDKTYYAHSPGANGGSIDKAFGTSYNSAFGKPYISTGKFGHEQILESGCIDNPVPTEMLASIDEEIRGRSKYVKQVTIKCSVSEKNILVLKPEGKKAEDKRYYCSFAVQVISEKNGIVQTGYERRCMSVPYARFWENSSPQKVADTALKRSLLMLDAKRCPAGKMRVLFAGDAGGTIIHEACGHGLEADIVDKDYSVYRGKIGQIVAAENVTMVDDPTIPGLFGGYKFDDEGTDARRNVLIENGVLKKYMTDVLSARLCGLPLTSNGRRESYRNIPVPRMSNTFLLPGAADFNSMLERCGDGLLVKKMGGGEVNPTSGDFVFYVAEAYMVRNGKIAEPVRGATLTGNGPETLRSIIELGDNLVMDPGICGKSGQGVPVTDGQPSMLINELTVGGSEG